MKALKSFIFSGVIASVFIIGCNKPSPVSSQSTDALQLSILPIDASTNVAVTTGVSLTFTKPMYRTIVTKNLFLISERNISDSLSPMSQMMDHQAMMDAMADSAKMHHLDQYHSLHGTFTWNGDSTQCTFHPDSLLTPNTQYMVHLRSEMVKMMDQQMGSMGMMGNRGTGMMSNEMMFHFTTKDTL
jgi:Bacterial Ig-like domain